MLKEIIEDALEEFIELKQGKTLVRVGRISQELQDEFNQIREEHNAEHEAMKKKIEDFIEEIKLSHDCDKFHNRSLEVWEKVYDQLGLSQEERGKPYSIKNANRIVYRRENKED